MRRIIKIFLASSITEDDLIKDRLYVGDFFTQLNNMYEKSNIYFKLIKCENYDKSIAINGKQAEYDREIRESELVFFLFFKKVGDYTEHEFEVALEAFRESKKPKIVTYFRYVNSIDEVNDEIKTFMNVLDGELKHYYHTYGHIDTLKLGMLMQIKLMDLDSPKVKIQDGAVYLNDEVIASTKNIPIINGHKELRELTQRKQELQKRLSECRQAYREDPTDEKEKAFLAASAELNKASEQLTEIEKQTLEFVSNIAEKTSSGKVLTYREKEALKYYNLGDYDSAQAILSEEERENELERAENRARSAKDEIQGYVNEDLLWIEAEKARGITSERAEKIKKKYIKVVELVEKYDLDKGAIYDFAVFLYSQNDLKIALEYAKKLEKLYEVDDTVTDYDKSALCCLIANLLEFQNNHELAEEYYLKAINARKSLAAENPERYNGDLASIYNTAGGFYDDYDQPTKAEDYYKKAIDIYEKLAEENPEDYNDDLADSYNDAGTFYREQGQPTKAEDYYKKAIDIYEKLTTENPEIYNVGLASSYNKAGEFYHEQSQATKAEDYYKKAIDIYEKLAAENPEYYNDNLAMSYIDAGTFYRKQGQPTKAEDYYKKAIDICEKLAAENPERYNVSLLISYGNAGIFYKDQGQPTKAEEYFLKDIEIREKLAAENPERYNSDLAVSYYNMGLFYSNSAKKKCKMYKKKALALAKTCTHDPLCRKIIEVLGE